MNINFICFVVFKPFYCAIISHENPVNGLQNNKSLYFDTHIQENSAFDPLNYLSHTNDLQISNNLIFKGLPNFYVSSGNQNFNEKQGTKNVYQNKKVSNHVENNEKFCVFYSKDSKNKNLKRKNGINFSKTTNKKVFNETTDISENIQKDNFSDKIFLEPLQKKLKYCDCKKCKNNLPLQIHWKFCIFALLAYIKRPSDSLEIVYDEKMKAHIPIILNNKEEKIISKPLLEIYNAVSIINYDFLFENQYSIENIQSDLENFECFKNNRDLPKFLLCFNVTKPEVNMKSPLYSTKEFLSCYLKEQSIGITQLNFFGIQNSYQFEKIFNHWICYTHGFAQINSNMLQFVKYQYVKQFYGSNVNIFNYRLKYDNIFEENISNSISTIFFNTVCFLSNLITFIFDFSDSLYFKIENFLVLSESLRVIKITISQNLNFENRARFMIAIDKLWVKIYNGENKISLLHGITIVVKLMFVVFNSSSLGFGQRNIIYSNYILDLIIDKIEGTSHAAFLITNKEKLICS